MKKGLFTGWQHIFSFTLKQGTGKKFQKTTAIVTIILLLAAMSISIIMAAVQKKSDQKVSPIQKVYVVDESELNMLFFDNIIEESAEAFPDVKFDYSASSVEDAAKKVQEGEGRDVILHLIHEDQTYKMELTITQDSEVTQGQGEDLLNALNYAMEVSKIYSSGISFEKLAVVMSNVNVVTIDAGEEEKGIGEEAVRMMLPMILIMLIYFFTIIYGLSMGNVVSVEKTSKLMEMLLTLTRPYSLILGKIAATTLIAVTQALFWVGVFIGGFFLGDYVAKDMIYPKYNNVILEVLKVIAEQDGSSAFSVGAFLLFVVAMMLSFLFYCLLAATFGSLASKAEELGQVMGFYQVTVVIGFFMSYTIPMKEVQWMTTLTRIVPLSAAFSLPGDILVGNISLGMGALYLLILAAFTTGLVFIAGKIYMTQLFHRGEGVLEMLKKKFGKNKAK